MDAVRRLLEAFEEENGLSYGDFKGLWTSDRFRFGEIHHYFALTTSADVGNSRNHARCKLFLEKLYHHVIQILFELGRPKRQVFAIYTLYSLYRSQPHEPKVPITITPEGLDVFLRSAVAMHRIYSGQVQCFQIAKWMMDNHAFSFSMAFAYPIDFGEYPERNGPPEPGTLDVNATQHEVVAMLSGHMAKAPEDAKPNLAELVARAQSVSFLDLEPLYEDTWPKAQPNMEDLERGTKMCKSRFKKLIKSIKGKQTWTSISASSPIRIPPLEVAKQTPKEVPAIQASKGKPGKAIARKNSRSKVHASAKSSEDEGGTDSDLDQDFISEIEQNLVGQVAHPIQEPGASQAPTSSTELTQETGSQVEVVDSGITVSTMNTSDERGVAMDKTSREKSANDGNHVATRKRRRKQQTKKGIQSSEDESDDDFTAKLTNLQDLLQKVDTSSTRTTTEPIGLKQKSRRMLSFVVDDSSDEDGFPGEDAIGAQAVEARKTSTNRATNRRSSTRLHLKRGSFSGSRSATKDRSSSAVVPSKSRSVNKTDQTKKRSKSVAAGKRKKHRSVSRFDDSDDEEEASAAFDKSLENLESILSSL